MRQADGTVLTGILAAETATSITLKQQGGKEAVIPRSEVDELRSTGESLMPEGLERQIPPQEMADRSRSSRTGAISTGGRPWRRTGDCSAAHGFPMISTRPSTN